MKDTDTCSRHGHLQQALHGHNLQVAHVVVAKGPEDEVDDAHLQNELGDGQQHPGDEAFLLALEVVGVAGEIRLEAVDGFQQSGALAQKLDFPHQPLGQPANQMEHCRTSR